MMVLFPLSASALAEDPPDEKQECSEDDLNCDVVVVTASRTEATQMRADATAPIQVIDRAHIEARGATTLDEALRGLPGVQVTQSHGGAGLSLQGLDANQTLVLIDGRPMAGRVEGTVDLSRIPVADIERIEIMPGPASALYGSEALGGVINIVMRHHRDVPEVEAAAKVGSRRLNDARLSFSGEVGPVSGGISANRSAQDGWDHDLSDEATTGDAVLAWGGRAWTRISPAPAVAVEADGDYQQRDSRGVEISGAGAVFDVRTLQETADAGLGGKVLLGGNSLLRAQLSGAYWRQQYLENQRGSELQDSYEETEDRRIFGNLAWQWFPVRHWVVAGVDFSQEHLDSARLAEGSADRSRVALYAQDDWKIVDSSIVLAISPGGRLDYDTQFGLHGTPHLALRVDPVPSLSLRVTGGQGFRAPEFKELYLAFDHSAYGYELHGNPQLKPERSTGATLDLQWTLAESLQFRGQGWWNEVSNLISPTLTAEGSSSNAAQYQYANIGAAVTRGAMGGVAWIRPGPLAASLDYTFTDARNREDDVLLDGRAPHRVAGSLLYRPLAVLELGGTVEWNSKRPFTLDGTTTWSPGYTWVDAQIAWTFHTGMVVETGAHNLLNARDDDYLGLAPRTFYIGLRTNGSLLREKP